MLDHIGFAISNIQRSRAFHDAALAPQGEGELIAAEDTSASFRLTQAATAIVNVTYRTTSRMNGSRGWRSNRN